MKYPAYPKYKKSGVKWLGDVPEHWEVKRLKYCLSLNTKKAFTDENPIALENIESWTGRFIETESEFEGDGISFKSGDILFGKLRPYLAKVYLAEKAGESIGDIFVLRPISPIISKYAAACLRTNNYIKIIDGSTYGSKMPRASWEFMGCLPFLIPPFCEQQAIAAYLDHETGRIDTLIDKKQMLIELLKEKRTALISHAVTKGLNPKVKMKPSGVEWLGDMPEHWNIDRLRRSSKRVTDGAHISPDLSSDDYAFVSTVDIKNGLIDFDNCLKTSSECYQYLVENNCKPFKDDVLFSKDGTVGRTALMDFDRNFVVASSLVIISPVRSRIEPKFLNYWLNNSLVQQHVALQMSGAALRRISVEKIGRLPIVIPPLPEQQTISEFLDRETNEIDVLITKVETVINKLEEYRIALISAAVTGKIDLREVA